MLLGKLLVHSLLQEGPSFPYLPKSVYVYMCTSKLEEALPFVSIDDLPFLPQQVVKQVSLYYVIYAKCVYINNLNWPDIGSW